MSGFTLELTSDRDVFRVWVGEKCASYWKCSYGRWHASGGGNMGSQRGYRTVDGMLAAQCLALEMVDTPTWRLIPGAETRKGTMADTFTEAVQLQTTIMLNIAKRLDKRGWAVMVHGLNREGENERYLYNYMSGAMPRLLHDWAKHRWGSGPLAKRRHPVIVHIHPQHSHWEIVAKSGNVTGNPFTFQCGIPNRKHFKEIHSALSLMCKQYDRKKRSWAGQGVLQVETGSDLMVYRGSNRDELEILIRVLDMPQHREILLNC